MYVYCTLDGDVSVPTREMTSVLTSISRHLHDLKIRVGASIAVRRHWVTISISGTIEESQ